MRTAVCPWIKAGQGIDRPAEMNLILAALPAPVADQKYRAWDQSAGSSPVVSRRRVPVTHCETGRNGDKSPFAH
jgi:hypothetical protein